MGRLNVVSNYLRAFASDRRGATAAEYVIILAIVGAGLGMSMMYLAGAVSGAAEDSANLINSTGCNNNGLGIGFGGGEGGGGGNGAENGEGNPC